MNKLFISFLSIFSIITLLLSNCGLTSLYTEDDFMNLGKSNTTSNEHKTKNTTIIIASSDSQNISQAGANKVILITEDAGEIINSYINALKSNGGTILLMEGTYYISTSILPKSYVDIKGMGNGTKLIRNSEDLIQIIYVENFVDNCNLSYFQIDGNSNFTLNDVISCGINFQDTHTNINGSLTNIYVHENKSTTFSIGFYNCVNLTRCFSNLNISTLNSAIGFVNCTNLSYCTSISNSGDFNCSGTGFSSCKSLSYCTSNSNSTFGYNCCRIMDHNNASENKIEAYSFCYADKDSNYPAANTPEGGYNSN